MSRAKELMELYTGELKDLWSANDQMKRAVVTMAETAQDVRLADGLKQSAAGIEKHTSTVKGLLESADAEIKKEHCRGMEGLVREALTHLTTEVPETGELTDLVIIAQYQRMSHYGLAGFGTAAAYAKALGRDDDHATLKEIVGDIYEADHYATEFAERAENAAAIDAAARA